MTDKPATTVSAHEFERFRPHLQSVAYRMLGSHAEAEDAVQEAWLRQARAGADEVRNRQAWLTTVVSRICLDMLRSRASRREDPIDLRLPDPVLTAVPDTPAPGDPEREAELADSVGLAMLVVLDTLAPAERLALVLHDVFAVPFEDVAAILERSPAAAKQLASRARARIRGASAVSTTSPARQWQALDAFLAAAREGDFERLVSVLHPDVLLRVDGGDGTLGVSTLVRGAREVASRAMLYAPLSRHSDRILVGGAPGLLAVRDGQPMALLGVVIRDGVIVEMDIIADPERLARLTRTGD